MSFALPPTVHFSLLTPPRPAAADSCRDDVHTVSTVGHTVSTGVYCANNPVRLVDVDGRTVVPNDEDARQIYNEYKSEVTSRLAKAKEMVSGLKQQQSLGKKISDRKISRAENEVNQYQSISDELSNMEESSIVFRINAHTTGNCTSAYGSTTYNVSTGEVNINVGDGATIVNENGFHDYITPMMIIAHELKHGFQYLKQELDFNEDGTQGGLLYDFTDEQAAIKRSALFGPVSVNSLERSYGIGALQNRKESRSYNQLTPMQKKSYDAQKAHGIYH